MNSISLINCQIYFKTEDIVHKLPEFRNSDLWQQAMTHRSYVNEHPGSGDHNERLEFLGDAILNFLCGEFLFRRFPDKPEGELTTLRSNLVDKQQLFQFAVEVKLSQHLRLGKGAERDGGRQNPKLLSSAFEALIGAYFLDCDRNIEPVKKYMSLLFNAVVEPNINYKSRFQEWALANLGHNPHYVVTTESGPDHAKEFVVQVWVGDRAYGTGSGRRKQDAEKAAAQEALHQLGLV